MGAIGYFFWARNFVVPTLEGKDAQGFIYSSNLKFIIKGVLGRGDQLALTPPKGPQLDLQGRD